MATQPKTPLLSLPLELIFSVCDHLPLDGVLALTLSHIHFRNVLSSLPRAQNATPTDCARYAIRAYLDSPLTPASHQRCLLCKNLYPPSMFTSASSPACRLMSSSSSSLSSSCLDPTTYPNATTTTPPEIVQLPHKMCAWHVARLACIVHTGPGGRNEWTSQMDRMCMHCGELQMAAGDCGCACCNCGVASVRTYTRFLNNETECQSWVFWRKRGTMQTQLAGEQGELWVREVCRIRDAPDDKVILDLPVQFHVQ